jgi:hydroxymethylglutaryl-CoA synthase
VFSKSVPDLDEDTATIAVEAARNALARRDIDPGDIGAVYVGSESHPYAVKPTACTVGEAICATPFMTAADYEFACKAGTAAIQTCMGLATSGMIRFGLAIGSDVAQGAPSDALEYTAAAGGAAYVIGMDDPIALIHRTCSFTTDTPDFWRREGQDYPRHGGRFTGEPGYFRHIEGAVRLLFEQTGKCPKDYTYAVFHQPNAKFPQRVAKVLGFLPEQIRPGLVVPELGNTYSGSSMIGLAATQATESSWPRLDRGRAAMPSISRLPMPSNPVRSDGMLRRLSGSSSQTPSTSTMHGMQGTRERS